MVQIIVDSTADMTPEVAARVGIVPLTVHFGEREYVAGVDIDGKKFYEMLVESDVLPTTSQPTPFAFEEAFREAVEAGYDVVCLTCAGKLSGTNQSANIAAAEFPGKVHVVDSQTIAIGLGILAEHALYLLDKGLNAEEIVWKLLQKREKIRLLALVDTLEYLKKGGRISSAVAFAGGMLNIKPVLYVPDRGTLDVAKKVRGRKAALKAIIDGILHDLSLIDPTGVEFHILQADCMADAEFVRDEVKKVYPQIGKVTITSLGGVRGAHCGPGLLTVFYLCSGRRPE